jgi:hypothetical protein
MPVRYSLSFWSVNKTVFFYLNRFYWHFFRFKVRPPIDQNAEETIRTNEAKFAGISDDVNFTADNLPANAHDLEVKCFSPENFENFQYEN